MNRFDNDLRDTVIDLVRDAIAEARRPRARVCAHCGTVACHVHCIYCGADCTHTHTDHRETCPVETGIYPVHPDDDSACCRCDAALTTTYHLLAIDGDVFEVVCAGCALRAHDTPGGEA